MNISLTPVMEKFVQEKVATGMYNSVSEVIREALRLLISKESISQDRINMLNNEIDKGLNALNSNQVHDGDSAMSKLIKKYESAKLKNN